MTFALISAAFADNRTRMVSGVNAQHGTTYPFVAQDNTRVTTFDNSGVIIATLPAGTNPNFGQGSIFAIANVGSGTLTVVCSGCLINGQPSLSFGPGSGADIYGDGLDYVAVFAGSNLSSPLVLTGGLLANGPVGVSSIGNGIYSFEDNFCANQSANSSQDMGWCLLKNVGPVYNPGAGAPNYAYMLVKLPAAFNTYASGAVMVFHASDPAGPSFSPATCYFIGDRTAQSCDYVQGQPLTADANGNVGSLTLTLVPGSTGANLVVKAGSQTGSNAAARDLELSSGLGTGNAAPGHVLVEGSSFATASSSTPQVKVTRLVTHSKTGSNTTATPTTMFQIPVAANQTAGLRITVHVETTQGTPQNCSTTEDFIASVQNTAATVTSQVTAGSIGTICSTGSLTIAAAFSAATPSVFSVTPSWATIVPTGVIITVEIHNLSQQDVTLL